MPVIYTNRKGATYILCQSETKKGKPRYFFARESKEKVLDTIPAGYEIIESVNGVVSLITTRPQLISDNELLVVQQFVNKHPKAHQYKVSRKHKQLVIHEGIGPDWVELVRDLSELMRTPLTARQEVELRERDAARKHYAAVMRFTLQDEQQRLFNAERMCYLGSVDDWIPVRVAQPLAKLARTLIPTLGTEAFFDLY
jgi:hypothetical protein